MEKVNISEKIIDEVEDLIDIEKKIPKETEAPIIFDGKQYTLKIPKRIANEAGINHEKDKFIFQIEHYPIEEKKKPSLTIKLKRGEDG